MVGRRDRTVTHAAPITDATEQAIAFCTQDEEDAYISIRLSDTRVVLCKESSYLCQLADMGKTLIVVKNPRLSFARILREFFVEEKRIRTFYMEKNIIVHATAVIGADGFGYERNEKGELEKFPSIGGVIIEDNVEIGACTCIDRGTLGDTIIREGCKIDNLVHIAHNVEIGKHSIIVAHATICGSAQIGEYCWIGPHAVIRDKVTVGNRVMVGMGAVVTKDVPDGVTVMGVPAREVEK
jgi:UDP-3-O-[3-hydroxymyristoyl] glucosamine N-acyltransferase